MNESLRSDEMSFLNESHHNPLSPLPFDNNFQKNPVFYNPRAPAQRTTNRILNVLAPAPADKLAFNEDFQDYLAQDEANSNLNVVTFVGPKEVGKSFLVDFLISKEEKTVTRQLSKGGKPLINMPTYEVKGKNGEKIVYFDADGEISN
jgi:polynucleotide 5'-kinase involved in rRNA processing